MGAYLLQRPNRVERRAVLGFHCLILCHRNFMIGRVLLLVVDIAAKDEGAFPAQRTFVSSKAKRLCSRRNSVSSAARRHQQSDVRQPSKCIQKPQILHLVLDSYLCLRRCGGGACGGLP